MPHLRNVSPIEAALTVQALLRREEFDPVARIELFAELAGHFRSRVEFPPEATDGITNEQYLRNLADILYRTRPEASTHKIAGAAVSDPSR